MYEKVIYPGPQAIRCANCGHSGGTLRRALDGRGVKVRPAVYVHYPHCPYAPEPVKILSKEEIWAERRPVKKEEV